jgi:rhomboid family GlyGly-CTERM serine protease
LRLKPLKLTPPQGSQPWAAVAALLLFCAVLGWHWPREGLDWQPALALTQPWRAVSAVAVHYQLIHLLGNVCGAILVGALGLAAQVPGRLAWAWLAAWPLTHWGLLLKPELLHYGGASGVLHAGVAAVTVYLLIKGQRSERWMGAALLAGLLIKVINEAPWGPALRYPEGWGMAVAPLAHATGTVAGAMCAAAALWWPFNRRPKAAHPNPIPKQEEVSNR